MAYRKRTKRRGINPRYYRLKKKGICVKCGKDKAGKGVYCDKCREYNRVACLKSTRQIQLEVLSHYCGGVPYCQCKGCRTTFIGFLHLDHVNGDGREHRRANGLPETGGAVMWRWVRDNNYPDYFQVLCANCNGMGGKYRNKRCPMYGRKH